MAFEELPRGELSHRLELRGRESLRVSGVDQVERFDEDVVEMTTSMGRLVVRGDGLHIEKLSLDGGDLEVNGRVDALTYEELQQDGFFARLFRG